MQKKHVCIVTNYSNTTNYGALLQAYALNRVVNEMGHKAEDLYYIQNNSDKRNKFIKQLADWNFKLIINQIRRGFERIMVKRQYNVRKSIMDEFRLSIPHTRRYRTKDLKSLSKEFDIFICGSDQIFRPSGNTGKLEPYYWLAMVDNSHVKASYAASIGVEKFDDYAKTQAIEYLSGFNYISIREVSAAEYLKYITGREDIITSIDPVFLLDRTEWKKIAVPYEIEGGYILVYMIYGTERLYKSILDFAGLVKLKIVIFPSMSNRYRSYEKGFGDIQIIDASPNQFIYLIDNAKYFFTDSFHATAFSMILHKNAFISRANEIAFSRINNIVTLLGADEMVIPSEGLPAEKYLNAVNMDWDSSDSKIREEREKSMRYLKMVIES